MGIAFTVPARRVGLTDVARRLLVDRGGRPNNFFSTIASSMPILGVAWPDKHIFDQLRTTRLLWLLIASRWRSPEEERRQSDAIGSVRTLVARPISPLSEPSASEGKTPVATSNRLACRSRVTPPPLLGRLESIRRCSIPGSSFGSSHRL